MGPGTCTVACRARRHGVLDLGQAPRPRHGRWRTRHDRRSHPVPARVGRHALCGQDPRDLESDQSAHPARAAERPRRRRRPSAHRRGDRCRWCAVARGDVHATPDRRRGGRQRAGGAGGAGRPARSTIHLRDLRRRQAQRIRRGGGGTCRPVPATAVQSAVSLWRRRAGQDASDARHRLAGEAGRPDAPGRLPLGREVHVPVRARAASRATPFSSRSCFARSTC